MEEYKTVARPAEAEFTERRSRFVGTVRPVSEEREALDFIGELRTRYWDAAHHVYAYVLREGGIRRYSDDGEPKGTAGIPVLEVLLKEGLADCALVVTRYFGGVLLGGGGLVRAYSHSAKIAVDAAGVSVMRECVVSRIACSYPQYGKLGTLLQNFSAVIQDTRFDAEVEILFMLPASLQQAFSAELTDRFCGKLQFSVESRQFAAY